MSVIVHCSRFPAALALAALFFAPAVADEADAKTLADKARTLKLSIQKKLAASDLKVVRLDGFEADGKNLKVSGVFLAPPAKSKEDQAAGRTAMENELITVLRKELEVPGLNPDLRGIKDVFPVNHPHIVVMKEANKAGAAGNRAADQVALTESRFDEKGRLVLDGVRGSDEAAGKWLTDAFAAYAASKPEALKDGPGLEGSSSVKAVKWTLSIPAAQKWLAESADATLRRLRIDRIYVGYDAENPNPEIGFKTLIPRIEGILIGKQGVNQDALVNYFNPLAAKLLEGGGKAVTVTAPDLRQIVGSWVDEDAVVIKLRKAVAVIEALDGLRIDRGMTFGPLGEVRLAGLRPPIRDDKQLVALDQAATTCFQTTLAQVGTDPESLRVKAFGKGSSATTAAMIEADTPSLLARLRIWVEGVKDDVRLSRIYFGDDGGLKVVCESPDPGNLDVQKELDKLAPTYVPAAPEPKSSDSPPKEEPKKEEPKKEEPKKEEPKKEEPKKEEPKKEEPKKEEPKKEEPKKEEPKKEEPKKEEPKKEGDGLTLGSLRSVGRVSAALGRQSELAPPPIPKVTPPPGENFPTYPSLTDAIRTEVAKEDPESRKRWDGVYIERGYFDSKNRYTLRGVVDRQEQNVELDKLIDSFRTNPAYKAYFTPTRNKPRLQVISMADLLTRVQRVTPAYEEFDGFRVVDARYRNYKDPKTKRDVPVLVFAAHIVNPFVGSSTEKVKMEQKKLVAATLLTRLIAADADHFGRRVPRDSRLVEFEPAPKVDDVSPQFQMAQFANGFGSLYLARADGRGFFTRTMWMVKAREWINVGLLHDPDQSSIWFLSAYYYFTLGDMELTRRDLRRVCAIEEPIEFNGGYQRHTRYATARDLQGQKRSDLEQFWLRTWKEYNDGSKPMTIAASFALTDDTFAALKRQSVPEADLARLRPLKDKAMLRPELARTVAEALGPGDTEQLQSLVMNHAAMVPGK